VLADTTDADGVVGVLTGAGLTVEGSTAVVQGTGGAARSAAVGLDLAGAEVRLRGRDDTRTRRVAEAIGVGWLAAGEAPPTPSILVNATPLGSSPDQPLPFSEPEVEGAVVVVDMVYGATTPPLAEVAAGKYLGGRRVLAYQGFAQFAALTGQLPPKEAMLAALGAAD